ncbi:MAG: hypothetical protein ACE37E_01075 [Hyphomicrobiales bacterium]
MGEFKGTPGPWLYRPFEFDDWGTVRAGKEHICQARYSGAMDQELLAQHRKAGTDPWEANARLIAAAPELLEAAQAVYAGLVERIAEAPTSAKPVFYGIAELHDAIGKALGETA